MSTLGRVVRAGAGRHRVQTVVIAMVVLIAVTAAVLGGSLLLASRAPFDRAFGQQQGAHLTAQFDPAKATVAELTASASAAGVSAAAGPFPTTQISAQNGGHRRPPMTVVGRSGPDGPVDQVNLTEGRWATAPGELVLAVDGRFQGPPIKIGTVWTLPEESGSPTVTVVGLARSVSRTADAWVTPAQVTAWTAGQGPAGYQMLYRLTAADTAAQVDTAKTAVAATVPAGALTGAVSWLVTRQDAVGQTVLLVPFLIAFGVLGVVMAVLIIGNVIAGAVSTGTYRIGILKALGFTPSQVVRAYLGQALIPAAVGAALGVVAGNLLTVPILAETNRLYGTSDTGVSLWVDALVAGGALVVVALTAWAAAARAGRLRSVDALAVGRTPRPGRGQWASRLTGRVRLPRPMTLGLAHPFARPLRSAGIVAAIAFGTAAVTFAVGLGTSLGRVQEAEDIADVQVGAIPPAMSSRPEPGSQPPAGVQQVSGPGAFADPAAVVAAITAQAGTAAYLGQARTEVTVAGITGALTTVAMTGSGGAHYYRMVSGTWLSGPGEIVVSTPFLTAAGKKVGDTVVLTDHGTGVPVRIVGEVFNTDDKGMQILTDLATLRAAEPDLAPETFFVTLRPGTDAQAYASALKPVLQPLGAWADAREEGTDELVLIINALTALLSVMLVVVAGLGVLNVVVLDTRERVHDLGVHKALGMTPRQTTAMVISSVVVTGLIGGAVGAAVGVVLQRTVLGAMGSSVGFTLPGSVVNVYQPAELLLFGFGGLVIAVGGALLPAGWAAGTRTVTALRTE
ncbi:ABC transporter permease [Actinoplanes sp. ATCC 53533]|uniref:ABC transporter permease n=1 Tax=Actinoplanes sp. ATCC 53533 TaxID=1288362 RepID=UPI000F79C0E5|nr:ABC transporter permease [Actinoplanes sp. ATCC 53533]RSM69167.1 ABC transporter permease [Actinoplanes sp. ATCC 53533]